MWVQSITSIAGNRYWLCHNCFPSLINSLLIDECPSDIQGHWNSAIISLFLGQKIIEIFEFQHLFPQICWQAIAQFSIRTGIILCNHERVDKRCLWCLIINIFQFFNICHCYNWSLYMSGGNVYNYLNMVFFKDILIFYNVLLGI